MPPLGNRCRATLARSFAPVTIERRPEHVLPTLARFFERNGEKVCGIIYLMGPDARSLLPKLLDALAQDDYWDLQWAAADAIGSVASPDQETMRALKNALAHQSGIVRSAAAKAFAKIGEPAVPLLLDMLSTDTDEKTQEWVAEALSRMGPAGLAAVPVLRSKLHCGSRGLRMWASIALAKIASDAHAVPALIEILEDLEQAEIWKLACDCLAAVGAPAAASREILLALTTCPVDEIRQAAESAIAAINQQPN